MNQIRARWLIVVVAALAAFGLLNVAAARAQSLPSHWDPATVAVNHDPSNTFLLRPGQLLAGPGDGRDVARVLGAAGTPTTTHPYGITLFTHAVASRRWTRRREVLNAIARVRKATSLRPQGAAAIAPNYVYVGEAASAADQLLRRAARAGRPRIERARRLAAGFACRCARRSRPTAPACGSPCSTPACSRTRG